MKKVTNLRKADEIISQAKRDGEFHIEFTIPTNKSKSLLKNLKQQYNYVFVWNDDCESFMCGFDVICVSIRWD